MWLLSCCLAVLLTCSLAVLALGVVNYRLADTTYLDADIYIYASAIGSLEHGVYVAGRFTRCKCPAQWTEKGPHRLTTKLYSNYGDNGRVDYGNGSEDNNDHKNSMEMETEMENEFGVITFH